MDLRYAQKHCAAVLQAWYPGARGGRVIADLLLGELSPSGKLPVTFYQDTESLPAFEDYSMEGRTYRYIKEEPLYPFGYGLTYGDIRMQSVTLEGKTVEAGSTVEVAENGFTEVEVFVENRGVRRRKRLYRFTSMRRNQKMQPLTESFAALNG